MPVEPGTNPFISSYISGVLQFSVMSKIMLFFCYSIFWPFLVELKSYKECVVS